MNNKKKYRIVFATNFKSENPYIQEWIEYHLLVGVDHLYLYDQDGGKEAKDLLEPYIRMGVVTHHSWTHYDGTRFDGPTSFYQTNKNHMAFAHCARNYRHLSEWMMKIDVDEFLYPPLSHDSLLPWIDTLDHQNIKGVQIPRFNFGFNNHETRPEGMVVESYTRREASASDHKDLANCSFQSNNRFCKSAHRWHYKWFNRGKFLVLQDENGTRINHYYTKSFEEYQLRQNVSHGRGRNRDSFNQRNLGCDKIQDEGMLRFTNTIKHNLEKR